MIREMGKPRVGLTLKKKNISTKSKKKNRL